MSVNLKAINSLPAGYKTPVLVDFDEPKPKSVPKATPCPCPKCGCPIWWEDLTGAVHCCECVPIPSRAMAKDAWRVERQKTDLGAWEAVWRPYRFIHWNPFGHLNRASGGDGEGF